jgi:Flp pilus assembly protein TadG
MRQIRFCQKGSIIVLFALLLPTILAFTGLAVDLSYVYVQRSHMQNVADAAALAGATKLGTSNDAAQTLAETYITKNRDASDSGETVGYTFPSENNLKKIRVDITKDVPLFFWRYFGFDTMNLTVHATSSYQGASKNIFDYSIISGSPNGILNLGPGGGNTYNGAIHSNYKISQGGGTNKATGDITAVTAKNDMWSTTSSSFTYDKSKAIGGQPSIDISVANSGLSSLINKIKSQNTYSGNYTDGLDLSKFGEGIYVTGSFKPSYVKWDGSLDTTTIVIADGDIVFPGNNGKTMSSNNHIIFCSLNGNITFTYNGTFYGILYAPNGNINLYMGGSTFNGSIVGKTLDLGYGNTTINGKSFGIGSSTSGTSIKLTE